MFEKLEKHLDDLVTEERKDVFLTALQLLNSFGHEAAWNEACNLLETASDEATSFFIDSLEVIIGAGQDLVLRAHAIHYNGDMSCKNVILSGLYYVQNWDDPESILDIIAAGVGSIDTFAELIAHTTSVGSEQFIDGFIEVSDALINKIQSLYTVSVENRTPSEDESGYVVDDERRELIRNFIKANPRTYAAHTVKTELRPLGMPVEMIVRDAKMGLLLLEPDDPARAALDVLGIAIISDIPTISLRQKSGDIVDMIYSDMKFITSLDVKMSELITGIMTRK